MIKIKIDNETRWNLVKYLIIGGSAFIVEYALFLLLRTFMHYIIANIIIYSIMFWSVFLANKYINFKSKGFFARQLSLYTALYFVNLTITSLMLYGLDEYFNIDPAIGKFFVSGIATLWNFVLYKFVIYKDRS